MYAAPSTLAPLPPFHFLFYFCLLFLKVSHRQCGTRKSQNWDLCSVAEVVFGAWMASRRSPCPGGPSPWALRTPSDMSHPHTHTLFHEGQKGCGRHCSLLSISHVVPAWLYLLMRPFPWESHGHRAETRPPSGRWEAIPEVAASSVLNGSLGPGRGFPRLPKLPGEHPGSSLGEKLLH